jgi:hypothetical protein
VPRQDKGKHGKFESLLIVPFNISEVLQNNTYRLHNLEGDEVLGGSVNGNFLIFFFLKPQLMSHHFKYHLYFMFILFLIGDSITQRKYIGSACSWQLAGSTPSPMEPKCYHVILSKP